MSPLSTLLLTNLAAPYRLPLFEALADRLSLTIFLCSPPDPARKWQTNPDSGAVRYRQLPARPLPPGRSRLFWNPGLAARLHQTPFDLYIAGENFPNAPAVITAQRAARRAGKPFILWSGAIDTPYAAGHWISNRYRRWLYRRTDAFIAYGERAKDYLVRRAAPPEAVFAGTQVVVPGWVWPVSPDKAALGLEGRTVALYLGYLTPRKGVDVLLRAYQQARTPNSILVIVGDGPQRAELETLAGSADDIRFTGYLEGEAKLRYYAAADLFVLPTLHDPWPQVIIEAMYYGLPVITTDADGSAVELRDNSRPVQAVLIVPAGDVPALAKALARLLTGQTARQEMGARSKALIASYALESACDTFYQAIAYVTRQHS